MHIQGYNGMPYLGASPPPPPPPSPSAGRQQSVAGLNRFTWNMWLAVVWGVPLAVIVIKFFAPGGTEKLLLMVATPFIIGGAGLLGWLPRFILARRGFRYSPSSVSAIFHVHWWAVALSILAINGSAVTDQVRHVPSPLSQVLPFLAREGSHVVVVLSFWVMVVSYIVLILLVSMTPRQAQARTGASATLFAMLLTPFAVIGLAVVMQAFWR